MTKSWQEVKERIEMETDKIFYDEPIEVTRSKYGIFPGGAGVDHQILGNLVFLIADTQAISWGTMDPFFFAVLDDDRFDVEHLKMMFKYGVVPMTELFGKAAPPECPAPWFNLQTLWELAYEIVDSFDSIKTKDEFRSVYWSWQGYTNCINRWFFLIFPWEVGKLLPRWDADDIKKLVELAEGAGMDVK